MSELTIRPFRDGDTNSVVDLIVGIQRGEFQLEITAADQPDLLAIPEFYQVGVGQFWVAESAGAVVGTLALKDIGNGDVALRKMFVAPAFRGAPHRAAQQLLDAATSWAAENSIRRIFLGTTSRFLAAHRFYEKNLFEQISRDELPPSFPIMAVDTRFYRRRFDREGA